MKLTLDEQVTPPPYLQEFPLVIPLERSEAFLISAGQLPDLILEGLQFLLLLVPFHVTHLERSRKRDTNQYLF